MTPRSIQSIVFGATLLGVALPARAQLVVFDPTVFQNAVLQYGELIKQYEQLVQMYQQIRSEYLLLVEQSHVLPVDMNARYRSIATPWLPFAASDTFGTTAGWILTANTGHEA